MPAAVVELDCGRVGVAHVALHVFQAGAVIRRRPDERRGRERAGEGSRTLNESVNSVGAWLHISLETRKIIVGVGQLASPQKGTIVTQDWRGRVAIGAILDFLSDDRGGANTFS